ncbi:TonB-dependent receptor [Xanthomonas hyacinthi]|uniref:TonB-dependent receptor n=1 Tax=Xanthomonas hyacinthi TaxID=56455 RepID=A0A2S7F360_9XANT|nr:TonB-dependent receptor [Xanthomonas hyacinthi]KLD75623.1 TonB-dependent receptor [Xanthomonas hyacinthi DSM 19077]PPU99871.1 TonB-dependent receptor [Xanthomonas hyacinthi]QGY76037.1 TonB-dependent receptor [Xanthomonas hyacinthi]
MSHRAIATRRRSLCVAVFASLPVAASVHAQSSAADAAITRLDQVSVIGSRTQARTVLESPVPIDVFGAEDLRRSGYTDLSQILQSLLPSFNFPHPTTPDGNTHIRSATLRGLSPDQTLVLVNGKRRHPSAWVNSGGTVGKGAVSTDLNAIPVSAIARIEVLRDGASAQYGSDAIAGVINIVLREDAGFEGRVSHGSTRDGGGDTSTAALDTGVALADAGGLHLTLDYRKRKAADRGLPDTRQQYFGIGRNGAPVAPSSSYGSGIGLAPIGGAAAGAVADPREATIDRGALWRFADSADTVDKTVFGNLRKPLPWGDALETYAFGGYGVSEGSSNASLRRAGQAENVRAIYPDGFLPWVDTRSTNASLGAGLKGRAGDWQWDLSSVYGRNKLVYRTHNTLNATLGADSPTAFYNGAQAASQWTTNLDARHSLELGWHAPLQLALGAEFRRDTYSISAGEPASYAWGPYRVLDGPAAGTVPTIGSQGFAGIQPGDAGNHHRHNVAAYVETETDLSERLLLSLAGRWEDYSDFGSTTNGKLALRYQLNGGLALRAAASTGFHAPALAQQHFSSTSSRTLNNAQTQLPEYVLVRTAPVDSVQARALGARPLRPEKASNLTAGLTWGIGGLSASLDAYRIDIDERIFLSSNYVDAAGSSTIRDYLAALGSPGVTSVRYFSNAADTRTTGVDASARYRWELGDADHLTATLGYNRNKTELTRVAATPAQLILLGVRTPQFDITERTRVEKGQPRDNLIAALRWDVGRWSCNLGTHRYGEIEGVAATNQSAANVAAFAQGSTRFRTLPTEAGSAGNFDVIQKLEARWVTDLDIAFRASDALTVVLGANNLFNTYPTRNIASTPQVSGADTFGVFPYSELSPFGWSGTYYYVRLETRF